MDEFNNMSKEDRDLLIRMDQNLINLVETFKQHLEDDKRVFKRHSEDIDWLKKLTYMGIGGLAVLQILIGLAK